MHGFVVFLFGISVGGAQYPWKSAPPIVMIILGVLTLVGLGVRETVAKPREVVVPYHLFKNLGWVASIITEGLAASSYYVTAIIWPQQVALLYSTGDIVQDGPLQTLPGLGSITGGVIAAQFVHRVPKQKWQAFVTYFVGMGMLSSTLFPSCHRI